MHQGHFPRNRGTALIGSSNHKPRPLADGYSVLPLDGSIPNLPCPNPIKASGFVFCIRRQAEQRPPACKDRQSVQPTVRRGQGGPAGPA
jgi:hypothetical protein